jgi:hypothetical protein
VTWNGNLYSKDTIIKDTLKGFLGCDSIYTNTSIHIFNHKLDTISIISCDTAEYKSINYFSNQTILDTLKKSVSPFCDSIIRNVQIQVNKRDTQKINACIENSNSYNFYGNSLTTSGTYFKKFTNIKNCDSIIQLSLNVITPTIQRDTIKGCALLVFKSINYTRDSTLFDTIKTTLGCDSLYLSHFIQIFKPLLNVNPAITGCDTVVYKTKTYTQSQTIQDTIRKTIAPFCDSILLSIPIVIHKRDTVLQNQCILNGATYNFYGTILNSSGIYFKQFLNSKNCDSFIRLDLKVIIPQQKTNNDSACISFNYKGQTYFRDTFFRDTIKSSLGCDSIYNISNWKIFKSTIGTPDTLKDCEKVIYKNKTYLANTVVQDTLKKQIAPFCDSITKNVVIIILPQPIAKITVFPDTIVEQNANITLTASGGVSYQWNKEGGTQVSFTTKVQDKTYFEVIVTDINGCQDTAFIWLTIYPEIEIPYVFSPNEDGINEFIGPVIKGDGKIEQIGRAHL